MTPLSRNHLLRAAIWLLAAIALAAACGADAPAPTGEPRRCHSTSPGLDPPLMRLQLRPRHHPSTPVPTSLPTPPPTAVANPGGHRCSHRCSHPPRALSESHRTNCAPPEPTVSTHRPTHRSTHRLNQLRIPPRRQQLRFPPSNQPSNPPPKNRKPPQSPRPPPGRER